MDCCQELYWVVRRLWEGLCKDWVPFTSPPLVYVDIGERTLGCLRDIGVHEPYYGLAVGRLEVNVERPDDRMFVISLCERVIDMCGGELRRYASDILRRIG